MAAFCVTSATPGLAQTATPTTSGEGAKSSSPKKDVLTIPIILAREKIDKPLPLSLLDLPPADDGIAGAQLGLKDNNTTGRFVNQEFILDVVEDADPDKLIKDVLAKVEGGAQFVLADVGPDTLVKLADTVAGKDVLIINYGAADDRLREEACRPQVMHTAPTRAMIADALAQYLVWKKWRRWFLVLGPKKEDKLFADALRRAAKRFGAKIVEERTFTYETGNRRADGGFEQIQQQIPTFTQEAPDYDVLVVADEGNLFGDYLPYRTWDARPVAGTAGLVATSWHPAIEMWGGTQFQNRFKRLVNRNMRPLDYNAWMAARIVGEAATRKNSGSFSDLAPFIKSPEFALSAFKGVRLSLRDWNGQLRQPVPVFSPKLLVSVSPQPGFLHQFTELDTLG
ncbi:MAG: ABC transporter substrate-binding protein, partial [Hyphomicrobiaceae bacterium]|nr:ABC transporter substrate-binding protein [Hyphomicrobiaceae bacterium]